MADDTGRPSPGGAARRFLLRRRTRSTPGRVRAFVSSCHRRWLASRRRPHGELLAVVAAGDDGVRRGAGRADAAARSARVQQPRRQAARARVQGVGRRVGARRVLARFLPAARTFATAAYLSIRARSLAPRRAFATVALLFQGGRARSLPAARSRPFASLSLETADSARDARAPSCISLGGTRSRSTARSTGSAGATRDDVAHKDWTA